MGGLWEEREDEENRRGCGVWGVLCSKNGKKIWGKGVIWKVRKNENLVISET